jgi:hypothetical protein
LKRLVAGRLQLCSILFQALHDPPVANLIARKLAVIMHRMWMNGSRFQWGKEAAAE